MTEKPIFVFGSNVAGRHGKGAALTAVKEYGATYGKGFGIQGNSFAIPTKDYNLRTLPLDQIKAYVNMFLNYAEDNKDKKFFVTAIGTGLAGYKHEDIAPLFRWAPWNCILPPEWVKLLLMDTLAESA